MLTDRHHRQGLGLQRLPGLEDPHLGTIDEVRVIRVHHEVHRYRLAVHVHLRGRKIRPVVHDLGECYPRRRCGHAQARRRAQVIVAELDVGCLHRHIGAPLDVRRAALRIIDRLAVDRNAH